MKYASLKPLKQQQSLSREIGWAWDTETKDGLKGCKLFCWSLATSAGGKGREVKVYQNKDIDSFFDLLRDLNDLEKKRTIYVQNLGFDSRFLIDYCLRFDIKYFDVIVGSSTILLYIEDLNYRFLDSAQFLQSSQEDAEKDWEIDKELCKIDCQDLFVKNFDDWNESDKERVLAHNRNDVLALRQIMINFRQTMYEVANVDCLQSNSLAGLSMKAFRKTMEFDLVNPFINEIWIPSKKCFIYDIQKDKEEFARKSYFGGRTEVFNHNEVKNAYYIDRVSMFPAEMFFKEFPKGICYWSTNAKEIEESLDKGFLSIIECEIICPPDLKYPVLPTHRDGKVVFGLYNAIGVWTSIEIKYALEKGYICKFIRALIYPDKCRPFKKFVSKFIEVKQKNKGGKRKTAKILLNSCYGKFGQKFQMQSIKRKMFESESEALEFHQNNIDKDIESILTKNNFYNMYEVEYRDESTTVKPFMNVTIASFVTSYSRIALLKLIHDLEKKGIIVYYCDTDSVVIDRLDSIKIGKELGNWDIEVAFEAFRAYCPKCYSAKIDITKDDELKKKFPTGFLLKLKGVRKSKLKMILENSHSLEDIERQIRERIEIEEQYLPLKSSLKREHSALTSKSSHKLLKLENTKRIVLANKDTRPILESDIKC